MKVYVLPGNPVPVRRTRHNPERDLKAPVYNHKKDARMVNTIHIQQQHSKSPIIEGPLELHASFYMPIPKAGCNRPDKQYHVYKPDLSHLITWIHDLCQGIVFKDDAIIASVHATKIYDKQPRTEFYFVTLPIPSESIHENNQEKDYLQNYLKKPQL